MSAAALVAAAALASTPFSATAFDCTGVPPQLEHIPGAERFMYRRAGRNLYMHVFRPARPGRAPAVVLYFGGGWRTGMVDAFAERARAFAASGYVAILPDYRVSCRDGVGPSGALFDGRAAYRWIVSQSGRLGVDPNRIVLGGGSAGGHLAIDAALHARSARPPVALLLYNPAVDLSAMPAQIRLPKAQALAISPIAWPLRALPPTLIMQGEADRTVTLASIRTFCRRASDAGRVCQVIAYEGQQHGFFHRTAVDPRLGASPYDDTLARSLDFLARLNLEARPSDRAGVPDTAAEPPRGPTTTTVRARDASAPASNE